MIETKMTAYHTASKQHGQASKWRKPDISPFNPVYDSPFAGRLVTVKVS